MNSKPHIQLNYEPRRVLRPWQWKQAIRRWRLAFWVAGGVVAVTLELMWATRPIPAPFSKSLAARNAQQIILPLIAEPPEREGK